MYVQFWIATTLSDAQLATMKSSYPYVVVTASTSWSGCSNTWGYHTVSAGGAVGGWLIDVADGVKSGGRSGSLKGSYSTAPWIHVDIEYRSITVYVTSVNTYFSKT